MKHVVNAYVAVLATTSAFAAGASLAPLDTDTETVIRQGRPKTTVVVTNPLVATLPEDEKKRIKAPAQSPKKRRKTEPLQDIYLTGGRSHKRHNKPKPKSRSRR
jgi:hypothetical protein